MHPGKKALKDFLGEGKVVAYDNETAATAPESNPADVFKKLFPTSPEKEEDEKDKKKVG